MSIRYVCDVCRNESEQDRLTHIGEIDVCGICFDAMKTYASAYSKLGLYDDKFYRILAQSDITDYPVFKIVEKNHGRHLYITGSGIRNLLQRVVTNNLRGEDEE